MTPFYQRLPDVAGFDVAAGVDTVGLGADRPRRRPAVVAHGVGEIVAPSPRGEQAVEKRRQRQERRRASGAR